MSAYHSHSEAHGEALSYYNGAMARVAVTPAPVEQRFQPGARVKISANMPPWMSHFPSGKTATVLHTYAHAFGGSDVKSYFLDVDGIGPCGWYQENQLESA